MPYLIDGYNLMHTLGLMTRRFGPDGLRRTRHRFLNDLAHALGPTDSAVTTVVFDANRAPQHVEAATHHKGLSIVFAVEDPDADSRIEQLITHHSAPKSLTVVSSDRRLRVAARRRGAHSMTADAFASLLDNRKASRPRPASSKPPDSETSLRLHGPSPSESRAWLDIFGELDSELASDSSPGGPASLGLNDADIRRIEREVEDEFRRDGPRRKKP